MKTEPTYSSLISSTIIAHPKRQGLALNLEKKLKKQGASVDITWDEVDNQWHTAKRALEKGLESEWHIIIEDDAVIGENFYKNALRAIENVPEPTIISFYTGTMKPFKRRVRDAVLKAQRKNASWISFQRLNWGVGIAINSKHILPMLERAKRSHLPYDERVGDYFKRSARKVYYTVPSIVDHLDLEPVNKRKPSEPRVAHNYSDEALDFKGIVLEM